MCAFCENDPSLPPNATAVSLQDIFHDPLPPELIQRASGEVVSEYAKKYFYDGLSYLTGSPDSAVACASQLFAGDLASQRITLRSNASARFREAAVYMPESRQVVVGRQILAIRHETAIPEILSRIMWICVYAHYREFPLKSTDLETAKNDADYWVGHMLLTLKQQSPSVVIPARLSHLMLRPLQNENFTTYPFDTSDMQYMACPFAFPLLIESM